MKKFTWKAPTIVRNPLLYLYSKFSTQYIPNENSKHSSSIKKMHRMTHKMHFVAVMIADSTSPYCEEITKLGGKLYESINYTKLSKTIDECEKFVRSVCYAYIMLIVTPDVIDEVFAKNIHEIRHVQSIFLFDPNTIMRSSHVYELRKLSYKVSIEFFNHL